MYNIVILIIKFGYESRKHEEENPVCFHVFQGEYQLDNV